GNTRALLAFGAVLCGGRSDAVETFVDISCPAVWARQEHFRRLMQFAGHAKSSVGTHAGTSLRRTACACRASLSCTFMRYSLSSFSIRVRMPVALQNAT